MRIAGKKQNLAPMWKRLMKKRGYWRTYIISWPRVFGMHSAGMRTKWGHHWTVHKNDRITYFCWSNRAITGMAKTSRTNRSVVLQHGGTCSKKRWAILRMAHKKMEQLQATSSIRKNLNQSENCQKFHHKLFWNACTWHELDDLTSCGPWTKCQDQSQTGLKNLINDKQIWILVKIVMWGTRHSTADLGYFKNHTLQATLRIQSQLQEVSCVFLEAEHLFQSVGCARNKHQFLIAPQSLKSFLWMLDIVWMGYLLLTCGTFVFKVLRTTKDNIQPGHRSSGKLEYVQPNKMIPEPRPNVSIENKGLSIERSALRTHQHAFFPRGISVVHQWRQRSRDQDDN